MAHLLVATGTTGTLRTSRFHKLAGAARSVGSIWAVGAIGSCWSSWANNTNWAGGASWALGTGWTVGALGTLRTLRTLGTLGTGWTLGTLRTLSTGGASGTFWTIRAVGNCCACGTSWALGTIGTFRTVRASGSSWAVGTIRAVRAGGSSWAVRLDNIDGFEIDFRGLLVLKALLVEIFSVLKLNRFDNTGEESVELGVSLNGVDFALSSVEDSLELVGWGLCLIGGSLDVEGQVGIDNDLVDIGSSEGGTDDVVDDIRHDGLVGDLGDNGFLADSNDILVVILVNSSDDALLFLEDLLDLVGGLANIGLILDHLSGLIVSLIHDFLDGRVLLLLGSLNGCLFGKLIVDADLAEASLDLADEVIERGLELADVIKMIKISLLDFVELGHLKEDWARLAGASFSEADSGGGCGKACKCER